MEVKTDLRAGGASSFTNAGQIDITAGAGIDRPDDPTDPPVTTDSTDGS